MSDGNKLLIGPFVSFFSTFARTKCRKGPEQGVAFTGSQKGAVRGPQE